MTLEHDNREDEHKGDTEERERDRMGGRVVERDFVVERDRNPACDLQEFHAAAVANFPIANDLSCGGLIS